jgi:hypothetical protein
MRITWSASPLDVAAKACQAEPVALGSGGAFLDLDIYPVQAAGGWGEDPNQLYNLLNPLWFLRQLGLKNSPKQFPALFSTIRRSKIRPARGFPEPTP